MKFGLALKMSLSGYSLGNVRTLQSTRTRGELLSALSERKMLADKIKPTDTSRKSSSRRLKKQEALGLK
jgi:hypothetical protein